MNLTSVSQKAGRITKDRKRKGRGPGSGNGKMAGLGHKGAKARSGYARRLYFEGGQMPMVRRLPKHGFNNSRFATEYAVLNVQDLEKAFESGASIGPEEMLAIGLINRQLDGVKVLAKGDITKKLTVSAHKFSEAAKAKIEAAGGTVVVIAE